MRLRAKDVAVRCVQRGYSWAEIVPCIARDLGDGWLFVDVKHPAYPATKKHGYIPPAMLHAAVDEMLASVSPSSSASKSDGPGTELKKLLAKIGITPTPTCSCNARARQMDVQESREPGWCEAHLDEIVGWLREEAEKRNLPFVDIAGRMLVRRAIRNARRADASS